MTRDHSSHVGHPKSGPSITKTKVPPARCPFSPLFLGEGSPTKLDRQERSGCSYSSLSTGGPRYESQALRKGRIVDSGHRLLTSLRCDPAGTVFQETLHGLPPRDQEAALGGVRVVGKNVLSRSPSSALLPLFFPPTKIDYRKKLVPSF